jgi:hypothetical protein
VNLGSTGWQGKGSGYPCYADGQVVGERAHARPGGGRWAQDRIRINTVSPGWVMTERQIALWLDEEGERRIAAQPVPARQADAARHCAHGAVPRRPMTRRCALRRNSRSTPAGPERTAGRLSIGARARPYTLKLADCSAFIITLAAGESRRSVRVIRPKASMWQGISSGSTETMPCDA